MFLFFPRANLFTHKENKMAKSSRVPEHVSPQKHNYGSTLALSYMRPKLRKKPKPTPTQSATDQIKRQTANFLAYTGFSEKITEDPRSYSHH